MEIAQVQIDLGFVSLRLSWHCVLSSDYVWITNPNFVFDFLFFGLPTLFHRFSHDFRFTFLRKLNSSSISLFQFLIVDFYDFIIRVQIIISVSFTVFIQILIDFFYFFIFIYILWVQAQRDCKAQSKGLLVLVVWEMCF